jgi:hypothetical protein
LEFLNMEMDKFIKVNLETDIDMEWEVIEIVMDK